MRKIMPVLLLMLPLLSGCGVAAALGPTLATNVAMIGGTAVSYSVVGQSPADYALSKFRGQDCDIRNPKKYDGLYCVNGKYEPVPQQTVYCYRSLGDADCTDQLDPYGNRNQPIVRGQPAAAVANNTIPNSSGAPVPMPTMLEPAGTRPVARPVTPSSPAAPAALTPADMATQGS